MRDIKRVKKRDSDQPVLFSNDSSAFDKGLLLQRGGRVEESIRWYELALDSGDSRPEVYLNLGMALAATERNNAALLSFQRCLSLDSSNALAWSNLGNLHRSMGRYIDAEDAHKKALSFEPNNADYWYNAGNVSFHFNQPRKAIDLYSRSIALDPNSPKAHLNRAISKLQLGMWLEGFKEYEWRLKSEAFIINELPGKYWQGEKLNGKTLLLTTEQGFGDVLQFVRYTKLLKDRYNVTIVVQVKRALKEIINTCSYVDHVVENSEKLPLYDYYFPLLSTPSVLTSPFADIPNLGNYLSIPKPKESLAVELERIKHNKKYKVGINWEGKKTPSDRGIALEQLSPLMVSANVQFYSLQYGDKTNAIKKAGLQGYIENTGRFISDFSDTAALMDAMDLVISVDSGPAHLAGALNVKTWVLLQQYSDWRWLIGRSDSPWYPNMTLFRQQKQHDWEVPIAMMASRLRLDS